MKHLWKSGLSALASLLLAACTAMVDTDDDPDADLQETPSAAPEQSELSRSAAPEGASPPIELSSASELSEAAGPPAGTPGEAATDVASCDLAEEDFADPSIRQSSLPLGKKCWATCTVTDLDPSAGYCPSTMGGYGNTTFLGGCSKACNKAKADAASKLPAGCVIHNCSFTGC